MKEIPIYNKTGVIAYTLIDDEDFDRVNQFKWYLSKYGYVVSAQHKGGHRLHRLIMDFPKCSIDHIDHNKLNNQKSNLRFCNQSQNGGNRIKNKTNCGKPLTSKYKGVSWNKEKRKWEVAVKVNQRRIHLGRFSSEIDAAKAYNIGSKKYFGEFSLLNEIKEDENPWFE